MSKAKIIPIDQKRKGIKVAVSIVAAMFLVALYVTIFCFSEQEGKESGSLSHKVTKTIVNEVDYVTGKHWTEEMKDKLIEIWEHPVRKMAHFSEYAFMGILTFIVWMPWIRRGWKLNLLVIVWVFVSAGLDEFHQTFVSGRSGNFIDVLIDTSGGCFGLLISLMISGIWSFFHERRVKRK